MDREIERSERASAALAATRALARASFTDSQLAAEEAAGHDDLDDVASTWVRTEYVAFDPTPQGDALEPPRHLIGGSFNPGIASQQGRLFPAASIAQAPIRTRSGAMARFAQESRHAPRGERGAAAAPRPASAPSTDHYAKPAVMPMLAPARPPLAARARQPVRSVRHEPARFLLAAALGAAVVLVGGGFAWKAGLLSRQPDELALVTPAVAAQAEAARLLSQAHDEIPLAPAAGLSTQRSDAEVDAALAAAARAAAVPAASVRAAGPDFVMRPLSAGAAPSPAPRASAARHATAPAKDNVDAAVATARARAARFLAPDRAGSAATPGPLPEPTSGQ